MSADHSLTPGSPGDAITLGTASVMPVEVALIPRAAWLASAFDIFCGIQLEEISLSPREGRLTAQRRTLHGLRTELRAGTRLPTTTWALARDSDSSGYDRRDALGVEAGRAMNAHA